MRHIAPMAIATAVALVFAVLVLAPPLSSRDERSAALATAARPMPTATASSSAVPSPTATPLPPGTFESAMLGYRISLPFGYRQLPAGFNDGRGPAMGNDYYTPQTEQQARDACNKDAGDLGSRESTKDIRIEVYRDAATPLVQWALEPPRNLAFSSALAVTHDGLEAARVVYTPSGELESYVVRANGRIYLLSPGIWEMPSSQPKGWLDDIAKSLRFITPRPFPTPSPTPALAPRDAAAQLARSLAMAFAAKDVTALQKVMPECTMGLGFKVDGQLTGGALNRSMPQFFAGLRDRFAAGDLTVSVDPAVQTRTDAGGDHFYVRSDWREPDRTIQIDLELSRDRDGRWIWSGATHYYTRAQGACVALRSPWTSSSGHCP